MHCVYSAAYYDFFPPKRMNVSVEVRETTQGQGARQVLVANKDFAAGEVIYKVAFIYLSNAYRMNANLLCYPRNSLLSLPWTPICRQRERTAVNVFVPLSPKCPSNYPKIRAPLPSISLTVPKPV
jgi:hypothetical protein